MLIGNCLDCGSDALHARGRCTPCYWKAKREALKEDCPSCDRRRILVPEAGICGMCVRRTRPRKKPTPRICTGCGRLAIHDGLGLCSPCYQRDPSRVATWTEGALMRLGDNAPVWFGPLAQDLVQRCSAPKATGHLRKVEALLHTGVGAAPAAIVAALHTSGRSAGATTRLVDEFFIRSGKGTHLDEPKRLAAGRRHRRLARVPESLRPGAEAFARYLLDSKIRAELHGHGQLADATIEARIADLAILAKQLTARGITDWAAVAVTDIEEFITTNTGSRLATSRGFFAFARRRKLILINPAATIRRKSPRGFAGRILTLDQQRHLLARWSDHNVNPVERTAGLLSLLHGASCTELRHLRLADIDVGAGTVRFAGRPHRVPLDPLTAAALAEFLNARSTLLSANPYAFTTRYTRRHRDPVSSSFMTHVLDGAGITPTVLRQTRLADLAHRLDPRLVAAVFGMTEGGALHYVTDSVDNEENVFRPHL